MESYSSAALDRLQTTFGANADPQEAVGMARYMRDQFPFLGIKSPNRRALQKEALSGLRRPSEAELCELAARLWEQPEREFQYAACDLLSTHVRTLTSGSLPLCRELITTKSWWDTVDALAGSIAGRIVLKERDSLPLMDQWINDEDMWLRRTAILHQLKYKEQTDEGRLFRYCLTRAHETEFFIRKAIGWALRQYSWVNPEAVRAFVSQHESELSNLSRREALLAINGGRSGAGMRPAASSTGQAAETG